MAVEAARLTKSKKGMLGMKSIMRNSFSLKKMFLILCISLSSTTFADTDALTLLYFIKQNISSQAICLYQGVNNLQECDDVNSAEAICMLGGRNNLLKCKDVKLPQALCMLGGASRGRSSCSSVTKVAEGLCLTDKNNNKNTCKDVTEAEAICLAGGRNNGTCKGVNLVQALCLANSNSSKTSCSYNN
jgi:hypothetical protein